MSSAQCLVVYGLFGVINESNSDFASGSGSGTGSEAWHSDTNCDGDLRQAVGK